MLPESDIAITSKDILLVLDGIDMVQPSVNAIGFVPVAMDTVFAVVAVLDEELLGLVRHARQEILEAADGIDAEVLVIESRHAELDDSIAILMAMSLQDGGIGERELEVALDDFGLDTVILLHEVGSVRGGDDEHDERNARHALDAVEVFDDMGLVVIVAGGLSVAHVGVWVWVWVSFQPAGSP